MRNFGPPLVSQSKRIQPKDGGATFASETETELFATVLALDTYFAVGRSTLNIETCLAPKAPRSHGPQQDDPIDLALRDVVQRGSLLAALANSQSYRPEHEPAVDPNYDAHGHCGCRNRNLLMAAKTRPRRYQLLYRPAFGKGNLCCGALRLPQSSWRFAEPILLAK